MPPRVIVDPPSWRPLGADEPTTGALVAQTVGWLMVGGLVGAALWALGHEIVGVRRGHR
jgi:hypothetical protein